jgi:IS30 family transposase
MLKKRYKRLSFEERVKIETYLSEKHSFSFISKALDRSRSTIGKEVNRWGKDRYKASKAHECALLFKEYKKTQEKINNNRSLKIQVYKGLIGGYSPEAIAGRLKLSFPNNPDMHISYESIYRHIYEHPQGLINKKLIKLLTRKKSRRRKPPPRKKDRLTSIKDGVSIEKRPVEVNSREHIGHWEGDLIIGANQKSCIGSIVERKIRYTILVKLKNKKAQTVCRAFAQNLNKEPSIFLKTMTYDNGTEMADHKILSKKTGMDIYFAHPYASWERGTNENTNGLVRRVYPKKTNFKTVSNEDLKRLQDKLNNRPRKVLGYYTPNEMYQFELNKLTKQNSDNDDYGVLEMGNKSERDLFSFLMPNN